MKSILLGYADVDGKGKSELLCGTEIPISEQTKQFADAKAGAFPQGIVRVEHWDEDYGKCRRVAICIKAYAATRPPAPTPQSVNAKAEPKEEKPAPKAKGNRFFGAQK